MSRSDKLIQLDHLQRQAYIYVRQSTLQQVRHHQESQRRTWFNWRQKKAIVPLQFNKHRLVSRHDELTNSEGSG